MNIKEAKNEVMKAVKIYLEKDEHGEYRVPVVRQRPLFLQGAPGLGKTAIMEQVASELDIALVSYSMTHHTRQSAIGLPFLKEVTYGGKTYTKSEYTMSEIIASVYDVIEKTGKKEFCSLMRLTAYQRLLRRQCCFSCSIRDSEICLSLKAG